MPVLSVDDGNALTYLLLPQGIVKTHWECVPSRASGHGRMAYGNDANEVACALNDRSQLCTSMC
jgi:hypothetical protein